MKSLKDCDPRDYQLMTLTAMLAYGLFWLRFDLHQSWIAGIIAVALITQYAATRIWKLQCYEWKSAAISGISLSILMRCYSLPLSLGLAAAAILSKFLIRYRGKHVFNPTNFALALGILATGQVWVNPGQWGNTAILAFLIICMGSFVVGRAARGDVSFACLTTYAIAIFAHGTFVGEGMMASLHRLQTGSLLVFVFFMISDPKTTPNSRAARILFGAVVALFGVYLQLGLGITGGLILTLAFASMTVPFFDRVLPGTKYDWSAPCAAQSGVNC